MNLHKKLDNSRLKLSPLYKHDRVHSFHKDVTLYLKETDTVTNPTGFFYCLGHRSRTTTFLRFLTLTHTAGNFTTRRLNEVTVHYKPLWEFDVLVDYWTQTLDELSETTLEKFILKHRPASYLQDRNHLTPIDREFYDVTWMFSTWLFALLNVKGTLYDKLKWYKTNVGI